MSKKKETIIGKVKRTDWSQEKVVMEIVRLYKQGESLNAYNIMKKHGKLYGAARTYWGSWGDAVNTAGFPYDQINKRVDEVSWSKESIVEKIKEREKLGLSLKSDYVQKEDTKLHSAAQRYFTSWKNACEEAGYDYEKDIKGIKWDEETIISMIKELSANGEDLSSSEIQKTHMDLFQASCRIFGSWKKAIEQSGLSYSKYRKQQDWTREAIFKEMKRIENEQGVIRAGYVSQKNGSLYQAARRFFGSWINTMNEYTKQH